MRVEVTTFEQAPEAWSHYATRSPSACIYHDARWKTVIEETYRHICHYLIALRADRPVGILPMVEIRSRWFGHFMVSLPFVTYGGIAAEDDGAALALAEEAARRCRDAGGRWLELRPRDSAHLGWPSRHHKVALATDVSEGADALWSRLSSRLRGKVRKAERSGASIEVSGPEAAGEFYRVFARNMRDLGTPVYPFRFFQSVGRHFSDRTRLFLVRHSGRVVAAALGLEDGHTLQLPWICSDYRYSGNYANEFLYWSVLHWAARQGFRSVDFGRSTAGSGNHRFKKQWNPEEIPLTWYYWTPEGCRPPRLDPDNPRFQLAIRLWRRLPLPVANLLGPRIVRCLP
jgi:FemAB-related protein (PEP-CTERM system-associated)